MRAGLLSEPSVIALLNENFVSTWVLIDELKKHVGQGDQFAETLADHWQYPLDLMFLTRRGKFVSKLNSFRDLPAHSDVGHPKHPFSSQGPSHHDVFVTHVRRFLDGR